MRFATPCGHTSSAALPATAQARWPPTPGTDASGWTEGAIVEANSGVRPTFLARIASAGTLLRIEKFGTPETNESYGVAAGSPGSAYLTGWSSGEFNGQGIGGLDVFAAKYTEPMVPEPAPAGTLSLALARLLLILAPLAQFT